MPAVVPPQPLIKKKPKPISTSKAGAKKSKPTAKNSYLDAIAKEQKAQADALKKMWAKDKKRKTAQIRTK